MDAEEKAALAAANAAFGAIADEAFERTGGDVYGTQPPAEASDSPPVAEEAAPEAATPTDQPAAEPTSPQPAVFGKYRSLEEAERGYHEAVRMGNLAKAEADAARIRLDAIERTLGKGPTPEPEDPLEQIENYGVPKDLIAKVVDARVEQALDRKFTPAIKRMEADQTIVAKYPEYQEQFKTIEAFVESQPEIKQQVEELNAAGNYLAARQIAYLNWKVASQAAAQEQAAQAQAAKAEEVKTDRKDAGVGKPRRADTRTAPVKAGSTPEEDKRLIDLYKAGHQAPYLRAKFGDLLPPEFDNVTAQLG